MNVTTTYTATIKSELTGTKFTFDFSSVVNATYEQLYNALVSCWANRSGMVKKISINSTNLSFTELNSTVKL